jgi:threonine dehydrogenase-like Zn-dependent dehydrogenase
MGCEVTVGDVSAYRINQSRRLFNEVQDYNKAKMSDTNAGRKFDIAIDASGKLLEELVEVTDKGGDILTAGLDYSVQAKIRPSYLTDNGIRIIGSIDSNLTFAQAINMLSHNSQFKNIVTHSFPLRNYALAFSTLGLDVYHADKRGAILGGKVVICPTEGS